MTTDEKAQNAPTSLSEEEANELVVEHMGWAESIARAVARGWNLDWKLDGLDGAAMEALIFCSRRYDPERGIPFKGYARKRIHEASTDAARKTKGWTRTSSSKKNKEAKATIVDWNTNLKYPGRSCKEAAKEFITHNDQNGIRF